MKSDEFFRAFTTDPWTDERGRIATIRGMTDDETETPLPWMPNAVYAASRYDRLKIQIMWPPASRLVIGRMKYDQGDICLRRAMSLKDIHEPRV
ncbi:hypothetical protein M514_02116 [Trichuris suis]|uniref:Uncharacterized protein n=2 Tax=Trichuris suis TaxID=68888 RepID=A0A085MWX2_9BILA|nr:hypothetical protein M514_02116 [Trichuris suis]